MKKEIEEAKKLLAQLENSEIQKAAIMFIKHAIGYIELKELLFSGAYIRNPLQDESKTVERIAQIMKDAECN
jgi:hypothetical protein